MPPFEHMSQSWKFKQETFEKNAELCMTNASPYLLVVIIKVKMETVFNNYTFYGYMCVAIIIFQDGSSHVEYCFFK